jgi:hypothetical protein
MLVMDIELSPAFCLSDAGPGRGLVTRAGEPFLLDEGLEENGLIPVALMPVGGDPLGRDREDP